MDIVSIILNAAKAAQVSGVLLLGICAHESNDFTMNYSPYDHGSPSYGFCQLKYRTAIILGFKGSPSELMGPKVNAKYAALYLKYQEKRYGDDWTKILGCPRNLRYIKLVQKKLPSEFRGRLECENREIADEDF